MQFKDKFKPKNEESIKDIGESNTSCDTAATPFIMSQLDSFISNNFGSLANDLKKEGIEVASKDDLMMIIGDENLTDLGEAPDLQRSENQNYSYTFDVFYQPLVKVFEIEYITDLNVRVIDKPPIVPVVAFYPYINSNVVDINISPSSGKIRQEPISILPSDREYFEELLNQQRSNDGKITFKNEGQTKQFQVFRIDFHPSYWGEFQLYSIRSFPFESSFREVLPDNQSFYYTFRSLDIHGNISNPTSIYKVTIVENSGVRYPVIETVDLLQEDYSYPLKKCKRFLRIKPSLSNLSFNDEGELGTSEESVYNKLFKIQITSKHTGKKIDLLIKFRKQEKIKENLSEAIKIADQIGAEIKPSIQVATLIGADIKI